MIVYFKKLNKRGMKVWSKVLFFLILFSSVQHINSQNIRSSGPIMELPVKAGKKYLDPYFTKNQLGESVMCFTEYDIKKDENVMCFTVYNSELKQFKEIRIIEESRGMQAHAESMSKLGIKSDGTILAVFRIKERNPENRFAGSLYYVSSSNQGETWSKKQKLVKDPTAQSQSFFDIARLGNGELGMVWLDSRRVENQTYGSCLYFGTTGNGIDFSNQKVIVSGTCQCCRTDIQVAKDNGVHVALRMMNEENIRDMYYMNSDDHGLNFSEKQNISPDQWKIGGCPHTGPSMAGGQDRLGVAWYTMGGSPGVYFAYNESGVFSQRNLIEEHGAHPQLAKYGSEDYALVFEETHPELENYDRTISFSIVRDGIESSRTEISEKDSDNSHPVISTVSEQEVLVVWSEIGESVSRLKYRLIEILD